MIRRFTALAVTALTLALMTAVPASAATSFATCSTGHIWSKAYNNIPVWTDTTIFADVMGYYQRAQSADCQGTVVTGARYNGCGATNANAWIKIWFGWPPYGYGYTYATCWEDT